MRKSLSVSLLMPLVLPGIVALAGVSQAVAGTTPVPIPAPEWNSPPPGLPSGLISTVGIETNTTSLTGPGTFTSSTSNAGGSATATATSGLTPLPYISASSSTNSTALAQAVGASWLTYWGEVEGPDGPPVTVDVALSATTSNGVAYAFITNSDGATLFYGAATTTTPACSYEGVTCPPSFNVTTSFENAPNELFEVEIGAGAGNNETTGITSSSAHIDPYFFLPPSEAGVYTLDLSSGVGNAPIATIPEPSVWIMTMLGFAGLGVAAARRSRRAAV